MPPPEPILTEEDRYLWEEVWTPALLAHAQTRSFRRHLDRSKSEVQRALDAAGQNAVVMVSGGKDSTALGELLHEMGLRLPHASEKDDLDYPGEEEHLLALAARWQVPMAILRPPFSLLAWLKDHGQGLSAADDIHSRLATFSREGFYRVVEEHSRPYELVFLGLRKEESAGRLVDRATHGPLWQWTQGARAGQWRCSPIIDWSGKDVLAYCLSRGVPLLPLYRCIAFMHRQESREPLVWA